MGAQQGGHGLLRKLQPPDPHGSLKGWGSTPGNYTETFPVKREMKMSPL